MLILPRSAYRKLHLCDRRAPLPSWIERRPRRRARPCVGVSALLHALQRLCRHCSMRCARDQLRIETTLARARRRLSPRALLEGPSRTSGAPHSHDHVARGSGLWMPGGGGGRGALGRARLILVEVGFERRVFRSSYLYTKCTSSTRYLYTKCILCVRRHIEPCARTGTATAQFKIRCRGVDPLVLPIYSD